MWPPEESLWDALCTLSKPLTDLPFKHFHLLIKTWRVCMWVCVCVRVLEETYVQLCLLQTHSAPERQQWICSPSSFCVNIWLELCVTFWSWVQHKSEHTHIHTPTPTYTHTHTHQSFITLSYVCLGVCISWLCVEAPRQQKLSSVYGERRLTWPEQWAVSGASPHSLISFYTMCRKGLR